MDSQYTIIPELVLANFIIPIIDWLREDIELNKDTPDKSYIARVFKPFGDHIGFQRYDYYRQAIEIFKRDIDHSRYVKVLFEDVNDKTKAPYLVIGEETDREAAATIGLEGMFEEQTDRDDVFYPVYSKLRHAEYSLTIVTDNINETQLIFHLLKKVILSFTQSLETMGLKQIEVMGGRKSLIPNTAPDGLFKRTIHIAFMYQDNAPAVFSVPKWSDILFEGTPINDL